MNLWRNRWISSSRHAFTCTVNCQNWGGGVYFFISNIKCKVCILVFRSKSDRHEFKCKTEFDCLYQAQTLFQSCLSVFFQCAGWKGFYLIPVNTKPFSIESIHFHWLSRLLLLWVICGAVESTPGSSQSRPAWGMFPTALYICPSASRKWQFIFSDATRQNTAEPAPRGVYC